MSAEQGVRGYGFCDGCERRCRLCNTLFDPHPSGKGNAVLHYCSSFCYYWHRVLVVWELPAPGHLFGPLVEPFTYP